MWVGCNPGLVCEHRFRGWAIVALAAILVTACSSSREKREETAATDSSAAAGEKSGDVLAAFEAWAKDSKSAESGGAAASTGEPGGARDPVIEQLNRKVSACWKQPFAMPRLAKIRLLVQFNPNGTVRNVEPRPEPAEAQRYQTETSYLVMIAQTTQALRQCQPYDGIKANFPRLSQVEMVFEPGMFQN